MLDGVLDLWLRLLALHLPEPTLDGQFAATTRIRDQWLLASKGYFGGCVPHGLEDACSTEAGRAVVRHAIDSLLSALAGVKAPLHAETLNLLGIDWRFKADVSASSLVDVGHAFLDLLDGKVTADASSTEVMPGSKPYHRGGPR